MLWRRSYDTPPPAIDPDDEYSQMHDARYAALPPEVRPLTECLKDVVVRMSPTGTTRSCPIRDPRHRDDRCAWELAARLVKHLDGISTPTSPGSTSRLESRWCTNSMPRCGPPVPASIWIPQLPKALQQPWPTKASPEDYAGGSGTT